MIAPIDSNLGERAVLQLLHQRATATAESLADALAIPHTTVAGVISRLLRKGLIIRQGQPRGRRGRPSYRYALKWPGPLAAFEFDNSQLAGAVFSNTQTILATQVVQTAPIATADEAASHVMELLTALLPQASLQMQNLHGAAVRINAIRTADGVCSSSVLPWVNSDTPRLFENMLGLPVQFTGPSHLAAEWQHLAPFTPQPVAYLHVGDGISGHFSSHGTHHYGSTGRAGEIGHIAIDPTGPSCGCGHRGCLESLASGPAIARLAQTAGVIPSLDHLSPRVAVEHVWQQWHAGDGRAEALMEPVFDRLAWGLSALVNMLDPELVILGGYVLRRREAWIERVIERSRLGVLYGESWRATIITARATTEDHLRAVAMQYVHDRILKGMRDAHSPAEADG